MERLGELAAFGTAVSWTVSSLFFEKASKRVGALAVNFYKVVAAFVLLGIAGFLTRGMAFPFDATPRTWAVLSVSGIIGYVIADYFLFNAYILIGARITVIFHAATPVFTAILGYLVLGERMRPASLFGMSLVVLGILTVVYARNRGRGLGGAVGERQPGAASAQARGFLFGLLSSIFQATGLIFSKSGLGGYDAISGSQIRAFVAIGGFALQALVIGQAKAIFVDARKDGSAMRATGIGGVFGPFIGVTLSLFAMQHTLAGTASTLIGLTPVLIIVPSVLIYKQKVHALEILGTLVAVAGTALFFLL